MIGVLLFTFIICVTSGVPVAKPPPLVKLPIGAVQGYWTHSDTDKPVRIFKGIPFAAPPTGHLRFKPPEPVQPWTNTLNATQYGNACLQKKIPIFSKHPYVKLFFGIENGFFSEDCLTLNIFAPKETKDKLPVMFWIYGGGFARGTSGIEVYDGSTLATEENVIVVTANYRLAALGFFYLGDDSAPGNMGLMDQVMALKWVQQNIEYFGGDPTKVTIFGQSAGSSSVGFHLVLPESQNLFQRAILQSGSPSALFSIERKSVLLDRAKDLLKDIGCPFNLDTSENRTAAVECLQTKDADEILDNEMVYGYDFVYVFRPVVDGKFIRDHPAQLFLDKDIVKKTEIMTGSVRDEGSIFLASLLPLDFTLSDTIKPSKTTLRASLAEDFGMEEMAIDIIMGLYMYNDRKNIVTSAVNVVNDMIFTCAMQDVERGVKYAGGKVYKYYFMYRTETTGLPLWMGIHHGMDLLYTFGHPFKKGFKYTEKERMFSAHIMKTLANFAKNGNPNMLENMRDRSSLWPEYTLDGEEYMVLAPNSTAIGHHLRSKYCVFWNEILPKVIHDQKTKHRGYVEIYRKGA